jgi:hypothetical protein
MGDPQMRTMPKNILIFGQLFDVFSSRAEATPRLKPTVPENADRHVVPRGIWKQPSLSNFRPEAETV